MLGAMPKPAPRAEPAPPSAPSTGADGPVSADTPAAPVPSGEPESFFAKIMEQK